MSRQAAYLPPLLTDWFQSSQVDSDWFQTGFTQLDATVEAAKTPARRQSSNTRTLNRLPVSSQQLLKV